MPKNQEETTENISRKGKMKRRTADWEAAKAEVAQELGLWDKVQREGWAALTAAESGRLGGVLSVKYPGKAPSRPPGSRKSSQNKSQNIR